MKKLLLLLVLPFLTQCSSNSGSNSSSASLPNLSSPARAQAWGAPTVSKSASGYISTYTNPSNPKEKLRIIGSTEVMPFYIYPPSIKGTKIVNGVATQVDEPQLWSKAIVQRKMIRFHQASFSTPNRAAQFRTLGETLKDPSGGSGQYRIEAEGTKDQVRTWLSELRFGQ